jgi:predicted transglutaminase-like cysteine proteinase
MPFRGEGMGARWGLFALLGLLLIAGIARAEAPPRLDTAALANPGRMESASPDPAAKWRAVHARIEQDRIRVERCLEGSACRDLFARPMAELVRRWSGLSGRKRLAAVNRHFNSFPYVPDRDAAGAGDQWLSPLLFLQRSGDCEDYAIAKYLALRLLGVPETAMAVLVLRDRSTGRDHAVLVVREEGRTVVLDNLRELARLEDYAAYRSLLTLTAEVGGPADGRSRVAGGSVPSAGTREGP